MDVDDLRVLHLVAEGPFELSGENGIGDASKFEGIQRLGPQEGIALVVFHRCLVGETGGDPGHLMTLAHKSSCLLPDDKLNPAPVGRCVGRDYQYFHRSTSHK
jgi:hypothetical protein